MDKNLPDIADLFKSALENQEEMPEPKVWEAIAGVLDNNNLISLKKKYADLKKVAFLLFFMLLGLGIYELQVHSYRNNTTSFEEITSVKKSGANLEAVNSNNTNKSSGAGTSKSNKTIPFTDHSFGLRKSITNIIQPQPLNHNFTKKKGASNNKKNSLFINEELNQQTTAINNSGTVVLTEIAKASKERIGVGDIKNYEEFSSKDYSALNALQVNPKKYDSVHAISLPLSPVLITVLPALTEHNFAHKNAIAKKRRPSQFSINVFFSPDFAYYRLQDNDPGNNVNDVDEIEKNERHEFSSTVGALLNYKVKKHWSIETGLTYSNTNIIVAPKTLYAQPDNAGRIKYLLNTSSGYGYVLPSFSNNPAVGDSVYAFTSTHTLQYLGMPISVKYSINKGDFIFNVIAGTTVNYLLKGKIETSVENGTSNEPEVVNSLKGLQSIYFSGMAGAGVEYRINNRMGITFQPTYRFALNSINKNTPVKSYPNSIGFATGIRLGL